MKNKLRYQWREGVSAFYAIDTQTGNEACMGDGVDMLSRENGHSYNVGTRAFYRALNTMFHSDQDTIGEAYFRVTPKLGTKVESE